jgi:hypothetical protein
MKGRDDCLSLSRTAIQTVLRRARPVELDSEHAEAPCSAPTDHFARSSDPFDFLSASSRYQGDMVTP